MNCSNSWFRKHHRQGLTLIEVVVGLALLGSLLAAVTLTTARHKRQVALAEAQLDAARVAQTLLTQWWQASFEAIPRHGAGEVADTTTSRHLTWRTHELPTPSPEPTGFAIVRFELYDAQRAESAPPLIQVDLTIADPIKVEEASDTSPSNETLESDRDQTDES